MVVEMYFKILIFTKTGIENILYYNAVANKYNDMMDKIQANYP